MEFLQSIIGIFWGAEWLWKCLQEKELRGTMLNFRGMKLIGRNTKKKLVLFDLDGVLLDSSRNMATAWQAVQSQLGVDVTFQDYFAHIGRPFADIMETLGLTAQAHEVERIFRVTSMNHLSLLEFYPSVEDTLLHAEKAGYLLGVVTSKDQLRTNAILALLPVDFVTVRTPEAGYRGKPAPDHLLVACAEANSDPGEALYIGDMGFDHEAAMRAGIDYVHAQWGYGDCPKECHHTINSMGELIGVAQQWS